MQNEHRPQEVPVLRVVDDADVARLDAVESLLALFDAALAMPSCSGEVAVYAERFPDGIAEHALRVWLSPKLRDGLELTEHRYAIAGLGRALRVMRDGTTLIRLVLKEMS